MKPLFLTAVALLVCLLSCQKHNNPAPVTTTGPDTTTTTPSKIVDSTLAINLTYSDATGALGQGYELIISEAGGNILLDSVAAFNVPVAVTLKTKQPSVNVSTIIFIPQFNTYTVNIFKAVQPAQWVDPTPGAKENLSYPNSFQANLTYLNVPPTSSNNVLFSDLPASGGVEISYVNGLTDPVQLNVAYPGRPNSDNYAYLLLSNLGEYSYHEIKTNNDTVDLSQMDNAALVHFSKPSQYSMHLPYMYGYLDTTDFTKYQVLSVGGDPNAIADLEYPPENIVPVQKYLVYADATTSSNESVSYTTFSDFVPTVLPWPATPIYALGATQNNSFSITFSQAPTLYSTIWSAGNTSVLIYAPPDSTTLQPLNLVNSLKSKMLQGQSLSALKFAGINYSIAPSVDYNGYFNNQCDPVKAATKPLPTLMTYGKSF
jgi:hypothetical protein